MIFPIPTHCPTCQIPLTKCSSYLRCDPSICPISFEYTPERTTVRSSIRTRLTNGQTLFRIYFYFYHEGGRESTVSICDDIANGSKHYRITSFNTLTPQDFSSASALYNKINLLLTFQWYLPTVLIAKSHCYRFLNLLRMRFVSPALFHSLKRPAAIPIQYILRLQDFKWRFILLKSMRIINFILPIMIILTAIFSFAFHTIHSRSMIFFPFLHWTIRSLCF